MESTELLVFFGRDTTSIIQRINVKKKSEKKNRRRSIWVRCVAGAALFLALGLGAVSSRNVSADTDTAAATVSSTKRVYKDQVAADVKTLSKSEMKKKYQQLWESNKTVGYKSLVETITERTRVLRSLQGFFPFLSTKSQYADLKASDGTKWKYQNDGITVDVASEKSQETAYYRMGTEDSDGDVTTWIHVDSEEDYNTMMALAGQTGGVKILLGYQYDNKYDGTNLTHYLSSGTDHVTIKRWDWGGKKWGYTARNQYIGQTYLFNASAETFDPDTMATIPETSVTRTQPASFILHSTTKDNCRLEIMNGTEGSGKYIGLTTKCTEYKTEMGLPYPTVSEKSAMSDGSSFRVEYNAVTKKCRIFQYAGKTMAHCQVYHYFNDPKALFPNNNDEYPVYLKFMSQYNVSYDYEDITDKYSTAKTSVSNWDWDLSPFWKSSSTDASTLASYNKHFFDVLEAIEDENRYFGGSNSNGEYSNMNWYACLVGGELGWSFAGYPSIDDYQKDKYVWKSGDMTAKAATTMPVENTDYYNWTKGKFYESSVEPNFNMWEDISHDNFGNFYFEYGSLSYPDEYIMRMLPETDYYAVSFDLWYGVDGIPVEILTEGSGGAEAKGLDKDVNLEDALTTVSTLGADVTVGTGAEDGVIFATKSNEVLYVPSDKTIKIEEGGYFIVTGNSVVILHGKIENKGTIIVQPGGVITYLQYESGCNSGINNLGGNMLVRDKGKVRVRYLTGSTANAIDQKVIDQTYEEETTSARKANALNLYMGLKLGVSNTKSDILIEGTVMVTLAILFEKGTSITVDGGALIGGDLSEAGLNSMFKLTDSEWVTEAVVKKKITDKPLREDRFDYSYYMVDQKSYVICRNSGVVKMWSGFNIRSKTY